MTTPATFGSDLLPCPFCGPEGEPYWENTITEGTVGCRSCQVTITRSHRIGYDEGVAKYDDGGVGRAAKDWNTRVSPPPATAQGWISTKERLPELWTDVMVIVASHSDRIYPRHLLRNDTGTWEDEWGHLFEGRDPESTVLAWRSLPEPPPPEHKP